MVITVDIDWAVRRKGKTQVLGLFKHRNLADEFAKCLTENFEVDQAEVVPAEEVAKALVAAVS